MRSSLEHRCTDCLDNGLVVCWSAEAAGAARRAFVRGQDPDSAVIPRTYHGVACHCEAGNRIATWLGKKSRGTVARYGSDWVRFTGDTNRDLDALHRWAENYRPANRVDFGEYS